MRQGKQAWDGLLGIISGYSGAEGLSPSCLVLVTRTDGKGPRVCEPHKGGRWRVWALDWLV